MNTPVPVSQDIVLESKHYYESKTVTRPDEKDVGWLLLNPQGHWLRYGSLEECLLYRDIHGLSVGNFVIFREVEDEI